MSVSRKAAGSGERTAFPWRNGTSDAFSSSPDALLASAHLEVSSRLPTQGSPKRLGEGWVPRHR